MPASVRSRLSLRVRLLLLSLSVAVIAVVATAWVTNQATSDRFRDVIEEQELIEEIVLDEMTFYAATHTTWRGSEALLASLAFEFDERIALTTPSGALIADSEPLDGGGPVDLPKSATALIDATNPLNEFNPCFDPFAAEFIGESGRPTDDELITIEVVEVDEFGEVSSETIEEFTCVASPAEPALLFLGFGETSSGLNLPSGTSLRSIVAVIVVLAAAGVVTVLGGRRILNPIAELTGAAERMEQGRLTARVSATGGDEIGQLAQAFNSMADALERSDRERRMLTSDIAHELRTPLSNIRGYLEAIQDGVVEASPDVIAAVHEEALLLQQLVDDLQVLALADAGELRLHREPTDLAALIEQAVTSHQAKAEASGVRLTAVSAAVPSVSLDPVRVRQVIGNLIDNAIRYTPRGGSVTVTVFAVDGHVGVSVADTGEGIAPDHLPHLFDRFYRPDSSRSRATGGSGLGLAIVQQLVTAHGGEVAIESTLGAGTTVIVTFARDAAGLQ